VCCLFVVAGLVLFLHELQPLDSLEHCIVGRRTRVQGGSFAPSTIDCGDENGRIPYS
jgi:hypothetical protein